MPPSNTPRHIRRVPVAERIKAWQPEELYLWASEELSSQDWDEFSKKWSNTIGISLNLLFIFARINSSAPSNGSDIFADYENSRGGIWSWLCSSIVYTLAVLSIVNYIITLLQTRSYRLFNADVNAPVASKSAHRVKVDAPPATSTPMRLFSNLILPSSSGAHTPDDSVQEVWEIPVWDPSTVCLRTSILFSPGHVLIVWLILPYSQSDPRPSVTIASTLGLCLLLSLQGHLLQTKFSQQSKDSSAIYKEVSKEYDSKFVQPNAQKNSVRDVGVQFPHPSPQWDGRKGGWEAIPEVVSGSPYNSPKGFHTKPNPAYKSYFDSKNFESTGSQSLLRSATTPHTSTFNPPSSVEPSDYSSPIRQIPAAKPQYRSMGSGDGGSLGVYTHAASPLRKAASSNILRQGNANDVRRRETSPLKRSSMPAAGLNQRLHNSRDETNRRTDDYY